MILGTEQKIEDQTEFNFSSMSAEQLLNLLKERVTKTEGAIQTTDALISDAKEYGGFTEKYLEKNGSKIGQTNTILNK